MYRNNDFIYEATSKLEQLVNIPIEIDSTRPNYDALLSIKGQQFIVEAKSAVRASNQGLVILKLEEKKAINNRPIILIAEYISKDATRELKERGINYIDISGNAFIRSEDVVVFIEGQKRRTASLTNQSRAFQEAGIKIIFYLLYRPGNLQNSYREIAKQVEVSLGSVSNVMAELEDLNYIMKTKEKRLLRNKTELLERWVVAYYEVLRPRILRNKMKFLNPQIISEWKTINLNVFEDYDIWGGTYIGNTLWGGEPGGAILTGNLRPEKFTIFTDLDLPVIAKTLKLVPDQNGNVEIFQKFWKGDNEKTNVAPALLVYADLINSGFSRNIETANQILENELQYIK